MRTNEIITETEAWQKKSGKNKNGGLNSKGVKSYRRSHPGSHLQTAVTTKPSKLKKGSKSAKRRASFCARMKGMKKHRTGAKTAHDPNSRINKSLRKWHCESIEEMQQMVENAQRFIAESKKKINESTSEPVDNIKNIDQINKFVAWSKKVLNLQTEPKITLSKDHDQASKGHHTGLHTDDGKIWVYVGNRNLVDIFRTIFHELVHHRQGELNMIKDGDSYPGSPIEAMADMMAGKYIKIYGKKHPEIFQ